MKPLKIVQRLCAVFYRWGSFPHGTKFWQRAAHLSLTSSSPLRGFHFSACPLKLISARGQVRAIYLLLSYQNGAPGVKPDTRVWSVRRNEADFRILRAAANRT